MQHIETVTVGSGGVASITFSAIPDTFTDLVVLASVRSSTTSDFYRIRPNGSTLNGSARFLNGKGTDVSSGTSTTAFGRMSKSTFTANTFSSDAWYLPNYRSAAAKSISVDAVGENNSSTEHDLTIVAGLWNDTSAITSVEFHAGAGNFAQHSSFSLYGITAGSDGITAVS